MSIFLGSIKKSKKFYVVGKYPNLFVSDKKLRTKFIKTFDSRDEALFYIVKQFDKK